MPLPKHMPDAIKDAIKQHKAGNLKWEGCEWGYQTRWMGATLTLSMNEDRSVGANLRRDGVLPNKWQGPMDHFEVAEWFAEALDPRTPPHTPIDSGWPKTPEEYRRRMK